MKKNLMCLMALVLVFSLTLAGCGSGKAEETTAPAAVDVTEPAPALGLKSWDLTASTWSSPNGATVHLTATPFSYAQGDAASFVVRLEGEDVETVPCTWDGQNYVASADLNAADGLCYYVIQTGADGNSAEIPVNTPNAPVDDALINMQTALLSYCTMTINASQQEGSKLVITDGAVKVQLPQITNQGEAIVMEKGELVLVFEGKETVVSNLAVDSSEPVDGGVYDLSLSGSSFQVPQMEDDQRVELHVDVSLSNGQHLIATGASWVYNDGQLLLAAG